MSTPAPPPADAPQVLLFGHSGAGKSSVLGALLRAAETEGSVLRGEVLEPSGRLASIRDSIYGGAEPARSDDELTSYVVRLRSFGGRGDTLAEPVTFVVNDCSGKAAGTLIRHPDRIADARTASPLARAVTHADALVLTVDAAVTDDELHEAFEEFDAFLTAVWHAKAGAREVGGFPILLVLTRCDKLAKAGDTREEWEARVRERADEAWIKFDKFLKDAGPDDGVESPFLPFGGIDLTVYAVAVRHPKLADSPEQANEPYRVAELFHDCFAAARARRERARESDRRLRWTVRFSLAVVTLLFAGVMTMALFPPRTVEPGLEERIAGYRQHEEEAAVRLAYPNLSRNKNTLAGFRDAAGFATIDPELRAFVTSRLKEIEDYEAYRGRLLGAVAPGDTRTLEDLERVEKTLHGELGLPPQYGWGQTPAAQLRDKWLADAASIRTAEARFGVGYHEPDPKDPNRLVFRDGYHQSLVDRGLDLLIADNLGGAWREKVNALLAEGSRPPAPLDDPLAGSPAITHPRGEALTNRVPYNFQRVYDLRTRWEGLRNPQTGEKIQQGRADELLHLRDLGDALGLTEGADRPALLLIPEPGPNVDSTKFPAQRHFELTTTYPPRSPGYGEWEVRRYPGPAKVLTDRLNNSFQNAARHVTDLLRARIGPNPSDKDTPADWKALANVLGDPTTPFPDWGRLLHLVARLRDPNAPDPVGELASFLRRERFDLDPRGFTVLIPRRLRGVEPVVPAGPLVVTVTPRNGPPVAKALKQDGDGARAGDDRLYRFTAGEGKLAYHPGDALRLELPVRSGNEELKLVWDASRTRTYPFDATTREPRMVKGTSSEPAPGVRLTPTNDSVWPQLPVLFPEPKK